MTQHVTSGATVVVEVKGRVLDSVSFATPEEAEAYKRNVRRWAIERGIRVGIWTQPFNLTRHLKPPNSRWSWPASRARLVHLASAAGRASGHRRARWCFLPGRNHSPVCKAQ